MSDADYGDDYQEVDYTAKNSLCGMFCLGMLLFPAGLCFSAYNERRYLCQDKAMLASAVAVNVQCTDTDGGISEQNGLAYVSCGVNTLSFPSWDIGDLPGLSGLRNRVMFKGTGVRVSTQAYMCKQGEDGKYALGWSDAFFTTGDAAVMKAGCGDTFSKPLIQGDMPGHKEHDADKTTEGDELAIGNHVKHAEGGLIKTADGDHFTLNEFQTKQIPLDAKVAITGTHKLHCDATAKQAYGANSDVMCEETEFTQAAEQPPNKLTVSNTYTNSTHILTCKKENLVRGCLSIAFFTGTPNHVTILSSIKEAGKFKEKGWTADDPGLNSLCRGSGGDYENLVVNRFCPSERTDESKNIKPCTSPISLEDLIETMHPENDFKKWLFRLAGWAIIVVSLFMICDPAKSLSQADYQLPCIGCCANLSSGHSHATSCCVSLGCGTGFFLILVGAVYLLVQPTVAGVIFGIAACAVCIATVVGHLNHKADAKDMRNLEAMEMEQQLNEEQSEENPDEEEYGDGI